VNKIYQILGKKQPAAK